MHFDLLEIRVKDQVFPLTLMETNLLRYLIQHDGKPVSRKTMLEDVLGPKEAPTPAPSITSSSACAGISRTTRAIRAIC